MSIPIELITVLLGAFVGGGFSLLGSHYTIKKHFEEQRELEAEQKIENNHIALTSIRGEILHNVIHLKNIKKLLEVSKTNFIDFKLINSNINLSMQRWLKHGDTIEVIANSSHEINIILTFYLNISLEITTHTCSKERVDNLINQGLEAINTIDAHKKK